MLRKLAAAAFLWLLFVGIAWFTFMRRLPGSPLEWLALVALGPPAYFLASVLGEGAFMLYSALFPA